MTIGASADTVSKMIPLRRAFLLPIVLVAVSTLALAVSIFAEQMLAEYRATHHMAAQFQAASAAHSGIEYLLYKADQTRMNQQPLLNLPDNTWASQSLTNDSTAAFFFVANHTQAEVAPSLGLRNESGKLNLNGLPTDKSSIELVRWRLMALPRMTPQIADAIMDWIDADETPRPLGAESTWYSAQRAIHLPAQRPIKSLNELLFVRGVTVEMLYGEDTNGNGWLDDCENDGATTAPLDNAAGLLDLGWSQYLTAWSAESNYRDQRQLKVHINQTDLAQLYDQLLPLLGKPATQFIVALRLEGPRQRGNVDRDSDE
ncbi:MAG: general secretion pathway protein GspK, partial [Pirellulaceae bacterium]|nr:general secretion pathway protein GspK [Pirellulaceae bacterium]